MHSASNRAMTLGRRNRCLFENRSLPSPLSSLVQRSDSPSRPAVMERSRRWAKRSWSLPATLGRGPATNPYHLFGTEVAFDFRWVECGPRKNHPESDGYR